MTRQYALKRLLEHGPMTAKEITACTGWTSKTTHWVLDACMRSETIVMLLSNRKKRYVAAFYEECVMRGLM